MGIQTFVFQVMRSAFKITVTLTICFTIKLFDILLKVHPPTRERWHKKIIPVLLGCSEDPDIFMNNFVGLQMIFHQFKKEYWLSRHGDIKVGDLVDADIVIHTVDNGHITRSCSLFDLVKPDRLLLLNVGSCS